MSDWGEDSLFQFARGLMEKSVSMIANDPTVAVCSRRSLWIYVVGQNLFVDGYSIREHGILDQNLASAFLSKLLRSL